MPKEFTVVHPIRHDGKGYNRGAVIPATKFDEAEATRLLGLGVIAAGGVAVTLPAALVLGEKTLAKMTVDELIAYGHSHGFAEGGFLGKSKDEILSEVSQSVQAGVEMADAEARAAAKGQ
jgi:hypothetical protein